MFRKCHLNLERFLYFLQNSGRKCRKTRKLCSIFDLFSFFNDFFRWKTLKPPSQRHIRQAPEEPFALSTNMIPSQNTGIYPASSIESNLGECPQCWRKMMLFGDAIFWPPIFLHSYLKEHFEYKLMKAVFKFPMHHVKFKWIKSYELWVKQQKNDFKYMDLDNR